MLRNYLQSIINHSLAIREDANGTWRQVIFPTPELHCLCHSRVVVGQESSADFCSRLLIEPSLEKRTT